MKRCIAFSLGILLILCALHFAQKGILLVESHKAQISEICIVIDAGHGGSDPGKVGVNDALEKDINLIVAQKLADLLRQNHISIVMTRNSDQGLYSEAAENQKVDDMHKRCKLIDDANPLFTVSIHQNSYPDPSIKGAQVFYYAQSEKGKNLAETIQSALVSQVDPQNHRLAKANESYYLLRKTSSPTIIVECGFLSNPEEASLLLQDDYQGKLANAVCSGILTYLAREFPENASPSAPFDTELFDGFPSTESPLN